MSNEIQKSELARQEIEWRSVQKYFWYFVHTYCWMWLKEGGDPIPFKLYPFQKDAAKKMQKELKLCVLKARQMGLSWLASAYVLWKCMTTPNFHAYYTSIGLKEVQEQMERVRFIYSNLPGWMQDRAVLGGKGCKDNDSLIEFTNGSAIHATASGKSAGHGSSPGLIICDEWARVEEALNKWRALKPSAGTKTQIFIISTSDGFGNHFAQVWMSAVSGSNGFMPVFYGWRDHPLYTEEYIEEQKRDFAGDLQGFMQAFPEKPEDAFIAASKSVFSYDRIRESKEVARALEEKGDLWMKIGTVETPDSGNRRFLEIPSGHLCIWKYPVQGHRYAIGVDVSQGLSGGDWSAFVVICCDTDEVVALYRAKIPTELYGYQIEQAARYYNRAFVAVEVNSAAELIMSDLKQTYPWLYMRPQKQHITDLPTLVPGFYTTSTSKPRIITQMRRYFSDHERPLRIYSDVLLDEMAVYEQDDKGRLGAQSGFHDDCVMACAIAIEAVLTYPYSTESRDAEYEEHTNWRAL